MLDSSGFNHERFRIKTLLLGLIWINVVCRKILKLSVFIHLHSGPEQDKNETKFFEWLNGLKNE